MQRLSHRHIVQYLGTATDPHGGNYLLMEFVAGGSLGTLLRNSYPSGLPLPLLRPLSCQLLDAVHFLHACGVGTRRSGAARTRDCGGVSHLSCDPRAR